MPPSSSKTKTRCAWCSDDPLYVAYHDIEWGVPLHDDQKLFELLLLEGFQAGLSWITVLRKRETFRRAFHQFDAERIAAFTPAELDALAQDTGIIRNKLKIAASVTNAKAYLAVGKDYNSFDAFLWSFAPTKKTTPETRATSPESDRMSKELLRHGFKFVGSTICYAFMQAAGLVDDHSRDCWKYRPR